MTVSGDLCVLKGRCHNESPQTVSCCGHRAVSVDTGPSHTSTGTAQGLVTKTLADCILEDRMNVRISSTPMQQLFTSANQSLLSQILAFICPL